MKTGVSRTRWIVLAASIALGASAYLVRREFPVEHLTGETELTALKTEQAQLRGNDEAARDEWRAKAKAISAEAWTPEAFAALEARLGGAWRRTEHPESENGFRCVGIAREGAPLADWPDLVRLVGELERMPGLSFASLDVTAGGSGTQRRFTHMAFTIRIRWAASNGNATRSVVPSPAPRFPALGDGPTRESGRAPSPSPALPSGPAASPSLRSGAGRERPVPRVREPDFFTNPENTKP